jgi:hypothetical protein
MAYSRVLNFGNPLQDSKTRLELIRILADAVEDDEFYEFDPQISAVEGFHGEPSILSWILNDLIGYNYEKATTEDRTRLAIHLCARTGQPRASALVRYLLPEPHMIAKMCHYTDSHNRTLLNSSAWALGEQAFRASQSRRPHRRAGNPSTGFRYDAQAESECLQDLLFLINEMVAVGSNLHGCANRFGEHSPERPGETPLRAIFSSFSQLRILCLQYQQNSRWWQDQFDLPVPAVTDVLLPVIMWLELLYDTGIDLIDYGRKEKELRLEGRTDSDCWFSVAPRKFYEHPLDFRANVEKKYSISFEFGPRPSDWHFWIIEEMDNFLEEFWDMVDHPERAMPGAWDERFDDSD